MHRPIAILGPTASGKSTIALELARILGAEIIACDSMTVYRGMDIGTAKPSAEDRRQIAHHLIDIVDISEPYNVSRYVKDAAAAIADTAARQTPAILCGGTGLYAKALLEAYSLQPADADQAAAVRQTYDDDGPASLVAEMTAAGMPVESVEALATNPRRLMRAVEVVRLTGALPDSSHHACDNATQLVLMPAADLSRQRIAKRTKLMFDAGWIDETQQLLNNSLLESPTAGQAMGYRLIADFLGGSSPFANLDELRQQIVTSTCRYAKRQRTWFRHQHPDAEIIAIEADTSASELAESIAARLRP